MVLVRSSSPEQEMKERENARDLRGGGQMNLEVGISHPRPSSSFHPLAFFNLRFGSTRRLIYIILFHTRPPRMVF